MKKIHVSRSNDVFADSKSKFYLIFRNLTKIIKVERDSKELYTSLIMNQRLI